MRRGFLNQRKAQSNPQAGHSKRPLAPMSPKTILEISQYPTSNNIVLDEEDAKKWAHKLGESQVGFENRMETQRARIHQPDFKMIFRNLKFADFDGVTLADAKIIDLLPTKFNRRIPTLENAYRIAPSIGKGTGMFATRNIPAGVVMLIENPVFVTPNILNLGMSLSRDDMFKMLFDRLQPDVRERALSLWNSKPPDVCGKEEGIVRTNGFGLRLPIPKGENVPDSLHSGTFLDLSRCNHSCGPNTKHQWDLSSYSISLFALRPIAKDEEITIDYVDVMDERATRRARLLDMYYFHCECEYCNLPSSNAVAESDAARLELKRWSQKSYHMPHEWCPNLSLPDNYLVDGHKRCIELYEREGIVDGDYATHMGELTMVYGMLGDEENFRLWGQRAVETYEILKAPKGAEMWKNWLVDPRERFQIWGSRIAQRHRRR